MPPSSRPVFLLFSVSVWFHSSESCRCRISSRWIANCGAGNTSARVTARRDKGPFSSLHCQVTKPKMDHSLDFDMGLKITDSIGFVTITFNGMRYFLLTDQQRSQNP